MVAFITLLEMPKSAHSFANSVWDSHKGHSDANLRAGVAIWNSMQDRAGIFIDRDGRAFDNDGNPIGAFSLPLPIRLELDSAGDTLATLANSTVNLGPAPTGRRSLGLCALDTSRTPTGTPAADISATWSDVTVWDPGRQSMLHAFIEAPVPLPPAADLEGARRQLQRQKPAHIFASLVTRPRLGIGKGRP